MERLPICRICLVENVPMYIVADKNLHELYEALTDIPFVTEDRRPMLTCYFCFAKLKQCSQLQRKCLEAEKLFVQMMNEPNTLVNRGQLGFFSGLTKTPVEIISTIDVGQIEIIAVKEEIPTVCERLDDVIEPKEEHQSYDLELENADIGYSDVEDVAHHYSESKNDVPLMEFKMEVAEEQEFLSKKRRASDKQRAPVVKNPQLHIRRTELDGVITEEQTKSEQSDTKVTQPYKCDICQRCFSLKGNLTKHIRIHTGEKPFKCVICQRSFHHNLSLTRHIRIHTGEKPFKCDICQRCFRDKGNLTKHIRTHTGEKPFKCDICQRIFHYNLSFTKHIRIHTGEKPFKCDICQRCFREKGNLTKHIRTHTGEKPFKCDVCQNCYNRKDELSRHIRTHTRGKR